jgi:hypothetical protein
MFFLSEEDDETAPEFGERNWRLTRNREVVKEAEKLRSPKATVAPIDHESAILENNTQMISQICLHPFEDLILVSDEHDGIK